MIVAAVFTDLDGTLLDPGGVLGPEGRLGVRSLAARRIPLVVLTSKTQGELAAWLSRLGACAGSFENGAGITGPWGTEVLPQAVGVASLHEALREVSAATGLNLAALDTLPESDAAAATGLSPEDLPAALMRGYDLPFLAPPGAGEALAMAVSRNPGLALTRGGRFWHLSGRHDKADAFRALKTRLSLEGTIIGLGDAPNDAAFLSLCDRAVIVLPAEGGPSPLQSLLPGAFCAPASGGEGWAAALDAVLGQAEP